MNDKKTIASYAENAGYATKAVSAEVAARCSGNAETASMLKDAHKIIFTGDAEATATFDGSMDLNINVKNIRADSAENDSLGNNIFETYATKKEVETCATKQELSNYARLEAVAAVCVSRNELSEYLAKTDFNFTFEKFDGVPYLFIEVEGKKYRFSGVEV